MLSALRLRFKKKKKKTGTHALTAESKERRLAYAEDLLEIIANDPYFLDWIKSMVAYDPETKHQSAK